MQKLKDLKGLAVKHKISVALVGGSLVVGSTAGQCVLEPANEIEVLAPTNDTQPAEAAEPAESIANDEAEAVEGQEQEPAEGSL